MVLSPKKCISVNPSCSTCWRQYVLSHPFEKLSARGPRKIEEKQEPGETHQMRFDHQLRTEDCNPQISSAAPAQNRDECGANEKKMREKERKQIQPTSKSYFSYAFLSSWVQLRPMHETLIKPVRNSTKVPRFTGILTLEMYSSTKSIKLLYFSLPR